MAELYTQNGAKDEGRKKFFELAGSLEEWLNYLSSFRSDQKKMVFDEASYRIALYDELIKQAKDTLTEDELTRMKGKLMAYIGKL